MEKTWTRDGISRNEFEAVYRLYGLIQAEGHARREDVVGKLVEILSMPFLDTVESGDALALRALYQERYRGDDRSGEFLQFMAHPALDEITDEEAKVILLLNGVAETQPEAVVSPAQLLDSLVSGEGVHIEERTVNLAHSGEVTLAIVRWAERVTPSVSMDRFETAATIVDGFMGVPFPTGRLTWYFGLEEGGGSHRGTHLVSNANYDDEENIGAFQHIVHETTHLYWTSRGTHQVREGMASWMKEGAAEMLTVIAQNVESGRPLIPSTQPCRLRTIRELEDAGTDASSCRYSVGQRLFLDLYHTLGEETFREGFRNLYLKKVVGAPDDGCGDSRLGICHLRDAFRSVAPSGSADAVDRVVSRWHDGTEPYDLSRLDHRQVNPNMVSIEGRVAEAFISLSPDSRHDPSSRISRVSLSEMESIGGRVYVHWRVTFPAAAQDVGVPMTTVSYYEDGFMYRTRYNVDTLDVWAGKSDDWETAQVGRSDPGRWALGDYGVYIYDGDRKVAQVEFTVVP